MHGRLRNDETGGIAAQPTESDDPLGSGGWEEGTHRVRRPPTAAQDRRPEADGAEAQPFVRLRRTVAQAAAVAFGRSSLPRDAPAAMPLLESDPPRLAMGFDYSVPCSPIGRAIGLEPAEAARALADEVVGLLDEDCLVGAEADGQYLNVRVARACFAEAVLDSAAAGTLAQCHHPADAHEDFCLVSPDRDPDDELLRLVMSLATNCSGRGVDPLAEVPTDVEGLVDDLVSTNRAETDPSGLTEAVLMGAAGERFLLRSIDGVPTGPTRVASRLLRSRGRPVLLAVGGDDSELVRRIENVVRAADRGPVETRTIALNDPWTRLHRELHRQDPAAARAGAIDLRELSWESAVADEAAFAVVRGLARMPDGSHRTLASGDPDYLLRFVKNIRRRLDDAESTGTAGIAALRAMCSQVFRTAADNVPTVPDAAEDESISV